jgi:hypothetical protein
MSECGNNWNVCLREAPLDERVLVIQERCLEPRTIHMNPHEIEWECLKTVPSQIFPMGIPPILQADHIIHLRRAVANIRITPTNVPSPEEGVYQESAQDIHLRWITLIEEYTGYKLTVSTDKLAAISGLASLMRIPSVTIFVVSEKTSFGSTCSGEPLTYCQILPTNSHESISPSHGHGLLFLVELSIYIDPSLKNAAEIVDM